MNTATTYQQVALTTQNQERIVVLLYEGAIRFLRQARLGMQNRRYAEKSLFLAKTQDILFELNASLNMEVGGEIAKNLRSIYTFLWTRLTRMNIKNDVVLLDRMIHILENLMKAWKQIED